ncbi:ThuA domain-containing protein [Flavihumibacter petaseus]|uniref:ThuA-like domain-containing protein n=1 Tax=Flavihumibacter petaseus NBRC 106054 TaxID=1220578 RepID=A0A0E9N2I8_9BACT|nr:ThuA domain-containing protein [Flavihumibacter petaseus]GAO44222.1 hypothetical protein FPE01S_03_02600 [Flavihumibacter petaseus NBRC 106054]
MKKLLLSALIAITLFPACTPGNHQQSPAGNKKVLVYSATRGYRHESIPDGIAAIKTLGATNHWDVVSSEDTALFSDNKISGYDAIVFLSTTGTVLSNEGEKALQDYVHAGGGIVGVHAATDCEYNWPWYNRMMGAWFESHPEQQVATLKKTTEVHPSTAMLPAEWSRKDEWYNFKNFNDQVKVVLLLDETSYKGGKMNGYHPAAWYHQFEGGKIFYTTLGHTKESYSEPLFLQHLEAGIRSVLK